MAKWAELPFRRQGLVVDLDASLALNAAKLSRDMSLPLADSVILATAGAFQATLWTQEEHFRDMEGVRFVARKSNTGR